MHVQELDDLAQWFQANVLDVPNNSPNANTELQHEDRNSPSKPSVPKKSDEQTLIEFITGIDGIT